MRLFPTAFFIVFSIVTTKAQVIKVYHNGTEQERKVTALFDKGVITDHGPIAHSQIDSIKIVTPGPYSKQLTERYLKANWKSSLDNEHSLKKAVLATRDDKVQIEELQQSMERFR